VDPRQQLAQIIMAMQRPGNPMGGPQQYTNDLPRQSFVPQLPQGWQPPGQAPLTGQDPAAGVWMPDPPPPQLMPIPRMNIPPGYHLRSTEGNVT
jgi:hypothetical protein